MAIVVFSLVFLGLLGFGIISLASSMWVATGIALVVFGGASFALKRNPMISLVLVMAGVVLMILSSALPPLSVGQTLSMGGSP